MSKKRKVSAHKAQEAMCRLWKKAGGNDCSTVQTRLNMVDEIERKLDSARYRLSIASGERDQSDKALAQATAEIRRLKKRLATAEYWLHVYDGRDGQ